MLLVYYTSSSGFTGKFVESLGLKNLRIPVSVKEARDFEVSEPYILISPTYGGGAPGIKDKTYIPKQVQTFLSNPRNRSLLRATIGAGQANFGDYWFCKSARDIALRHNVPYLGGFELSGLPGEDTHILKKIKEFDSGMSHKESSTDYIEFNASLNLWSYDEDGKEYIDFGKDKEAARQYHLQYVNKHTQYFPSLEDKLDYLFDNDYYVRGPFDKFNFEELKGLYKQAYTFKHRFTSFLGAMKFYSSYALRSNDGKTILERFEDRVVANAVLLSEGDLSLAQDLVDEIISGRLQPATPTFSNACKKRSGELVSCFLISSQDSMSSIARILHSALQLSKMGGGVGVDLSSIRADGDPIKGISGQASGVLPVAKLLDDSFSYANQLGQRAGAGVVYLSVVHPDFTTLLDAKRANADEKIRLKTISIGVVIPDVVFELAKRNEDLQQFSPHDIYKVYGKELSYIDMDEEYYKILNDSRIRKVSKVNARKLFTLIAQTQSESGYPYLMFSGAVDRANPITDGRAVMSNLCVTGDTRLLTDKGYKTALELFESQEGFDVIVDEGARTMEYSSIGKLSMVPSSRMFKTAENVDVFEVRTSGGHSIKATEWHKFYVATPENSLKKIQLNELSIGDVLLYTGISGEYGEAFKTPMGSYPVELSPITYIGYCGKEDVYDVTVEDGHSVIFNGIVTGNCSEILQSQQPSVVNEDGTYATVGRDVSCNLASLNITKAMRGGNLEKTVDTAIRGLTAVSDLSNIDAVPTVKRANNELHSVGLGAFSLHEFFLSEGISYASQVPADTYGNTGLRHASVEAKDFTNIYFMVVNYLALKTSNDLARHRSETFVGFESSKYADPEYLKTKYSQEDHILPGETSKRIFSKYGITIPTYEDWAKLADDIAEYGLYNAYLQAVPPTGSISYINGGTSSIHPAVAVIEGRKEGKVGKVYYATPGVTNENRSQFEDAYEVGPVAIIDVYAEAQKHIDQALSLTLFYTEDHTTRTYNQMYKYAHSKSLKTLYYARVRSNNVEGTSIEECVSCTL